LPWAVPVEGEPFRAGLSAVDASWRLTFGSGAKQRMAPAAELVRWGRCVDVRRGPLVLLADGGQLVSDTLTADRETLTAETGLFGRVRLPLELLAGVVFQLPANRHRRDLLLDRIVASKGDSDRVMLLNGDAVTGSITGLDDETIRLETDAGPLSIRTDRVAAVVFNPALRRHVPSRGPRGWVGLADGSRLIATRLLLEGKSLTITIAGGSELSTPHKPPLAASHQKTITAAEELVFLQPLGGRVTYLSDLKPAGYRHVPFLDLPWPWRADRNVAGGRLRAAGRLYLKGIGVHSAARLTYTLDGPYRRFEAELAVDDSTAGGGSVRFRVHVDGRQKYTSEIIRGGGKPVPVRVDLAALASGSRIDLFVDYADRADQLDRADWLDARLVK
jgi:hypothetical protein